MTTWIHVFAAIVFNIIRTGIIEMGFALKENKLISLKSSQISYIRLTSRHLAIGFILL